MFRIINTEYMMLIEMTFHSKQFADCIMTDCVWWRLSESRNTVFAVLMFTVV